MDFQAGTRQPGCEFCRATPVETDALECGSLIDQGIEIVGFSGADVGIERAGPHTGAVDIPDADPMRQNAPDTFGVRKLGERFGEDCAKQFPEMILPVPVILLGRQGRRGWETPQDQAADAGIENRGQAGQPDEFMRCCGYAHGVRRICPAQRIKLVGDAWLPSQRPYYQHFSGFMR